MNKNCTLAGTFIQWYKKIMSVYQVIEVPLLSFRRLIYHSLFIQACPEATNLLILSDLKTKSRGFSR